MKDTNYLQTGQTDFLIFVLSQLEQAVQQLQVAEKEMEVVMSRQVVRDGCKHILSNHLIAVSDSDSDEFLQDLEHLVGSNQVAFLDTEEEGCFD